MFFKKLFKKNHTHFIEQGEALLADDRYADARHAFTEARALLPTSLPDGDSLDAHLASRIAVTEDKLGALNLAEAEHALARGDVARAEDHLLLAKELAHDPLIREKAEEIFHLCRNHVPETRPASRQHSCSGCNEPGGSHGGTTQDESVHLTDRDRFELLIHPLPGDLPSRYSLLGDDFAYAYLLNHDGSSDKALAIYDELLSHQPDDVVLYEKSLILHGRDDGRGCEECLRNAYALNPHNPLVCLGLAQLFSGTERFSEAMATLEHMIASGLMVESALLLKGDILQVTNEEDQALHIYSQLLSNGSAAKTAATRMTELLDKLGRQAEAEFIYKRHLKGCC